MARRKETDEEVCARIVGSLDRAHEKAQAAQSKARIAEFKAKYPPDVIERWVRVVDCGPSEEEIYAAVTIIRRLADRASAEVSLNNYRQEFDRL